MADSGTAAEMNGRHLLQKNIKMLSEEEKILVVICPRNAVECSTYFKLKGC
jgi:hypothetical protein